MINVIGKVVWKDDTGTRIEISRAGCSACRGNCGDVQTILLPGVAGTRNQALALSLANTAFFRILIHSLGLPLVGFVAGSSIAHFLYGGDFATFSGALTGLAIGLLLCRRQTLDLIFIREAVNNG